MPENSTAPDETRGEISGAQLSADTLEALAVDTPLLPPKESLITRLAGYFGRHLLLLFWVSFACLWAILSLPSPFYQTDFSVGIAAPRDYAAPQAAYLPDRTETERRREAAAALVTPAYDPAPSAQSEALSLLREVAERNRRGAALIRLQAANQPQNRVFSPDFKRFEAIAGWKPAPGLVPTLRDLQSARWKRIEKGAESAVRSAYLHGRIRSDVGEDLNAIRPRLRAAIAIFAAREELSAGEAGIALQTAILAVKFPNVVVNEKATDDARGDAAEAVLPVFVRVEANTPLVREGERVSLEQFDQLQELGIIAPQFRWLEALAHGAMCLLLVAGASAYLARGRRDLLRRPAALWLVAVIPVLFLAAFRLFLRVPHADFLMVPLAATAAMLLTVLIDTRVGLPAGFMVAALCALMARAEASLFLAATLSAWIGALSVAQLASRLSLLRSVAVLTLSNAILAASLSVLRQTTLEELLSSVVWSILAGAASVGGMWILASVLERPFGITSQLRLLELLAPDETVIQRMQLEAPGTYTHSMTVAILAEAAAKAIGADPLLCRVAGLYHDIGKLRRPHCFIENQSGDNIHDRLTPGLSALLIKAHVKDGIELGRAIRLPQPILDVVASHHGTSTIAYFLHRARQMAETEAHLHSQSAAGTPLEGSGIDEMIFRYPGPKPRSRESALVMLADSVEASARSLPQITPEILEKHVQCIISARLAEGELDDCELSFKEMALVRDSFVAVLRGVMHGRIAYPDPATLSGELSMHSRDWVRQTLGEKSEENTPKPTKVATKAEKRQNKDGQNFEKRRAKAGFNPKAKAERKNETNPKSPVSATEFDGTQTDTSAPQIESSPLPKARRRRFKPPFHATSPGTSNRETSNRENPDGENPDGERASRGDASALFANEPELEPGGENGAHGSLGATHDTADQENGANGHHSDAANGSATLSGAQNATQTH